MKLQQHIYYELLLIIGSVFVFRGLWTLMDRVPVRSLFSGGCGL